MASGSNLRIVREFLLSPGAELGVKIKWIRRKMRLVIVSVLLDCDISTGVSEELCRTNVYLADSNVSSECAIRRWRVLHGYVAYQSPLRGDWVSKAASHVSRWMWCVQFNIMLRTMTGCSETPVQF